MISMTIVPCDGRGCPDYTKSEHVVMPIVPRAKEKIIHRIDRKRITRKVIEVQHVKESGLSQVYNIMVYVFDYCEITSLGTSPAQARIIE